VPFDLIGLDLFCFVSFRFSLVLCGFFFLADLSLAYPLLFIQKTVFVSLQQWIADTV